MKMHQIFFYKELLLISLFRSNPFSSKNRYGLFDLLVDLSWPDLFFS